MGSLIMTTLQDHMIPRDLVECLRIEADHARHGKSEMAADIQARMAIGRAMKKAP